MHAKDAVRAVKYVNGLKYKPGWEITATYVGLDTLHVKMYIDTVDSRREDAPYGYPSHITLDRSFYIENVTEKTREQLYADVFTQIADVEAHEMREFFRDSLDDWKAPFHPHTRDGEAGYAQLIIKSMRKPSYADMQNSYGGTVL